jgi:hypothetical protein
MSVDLALARAIIAVRDGVFGMPLDFALNRLAMCLGVRHPRASTRRAIKAMCICALAPSPADVQTRTFNYSLDQLPLISTNTADRSCACRATTPFARPCSRPPLIRSILG